MVLPLPGGGRGALSWIRGSPSPAPRPLGARVRAPAGWRISDAPGVPSAARWVRVPPPPPRHSISIFGRGAIAADPGIGPVGDLALVFGEVGAPRVRLDGFLGLPDDVELTVGLDFPDHHRLRQMMVGVHD